MNFMKWPTEKLVTSIRRSISLQLITALIVRAFLGYSGAGMVVTVFEHINKVATIDHSGDMESINWQAQLTSETTAKENTLEAIKKFINEQNEVAGGGLDALKVL